MRASVSSTREPMKPESRPSSEQGLVSAGNLTGPLITSSPSTPVKHTSLVCEVSSVCIKRLFDNAGFLRTKPRDSALRAVTKEVVGLHVLLTGSLFGDDILRRLLLRVSLAKPTSAPLRF